MGDGKAVVDGVLKVGDKTVQILRFLIPLSFLFIRSSITPYMHIDTYTNSHNLSCFLLLFSRRANLKTTTGRLPKIKTKTRTQTHTIKIEEARTLSVEETFEVGDAEEEEDVEVSTTDGEDNPSPTLEREQMIPLWVHRDIHLLRLNLRS
ncbi:hypothetical protein K435DRAFT_778442 [Dendrothele bispora CBS 962.96]|uniref:Uncharacterized protein n=1 Tax=Dendrothele bispora (strain CBS 962.96) TaxID=1314807 RepID=A0A4S8M4Y4_DENBC|nr:hypothetical protein K435DRAFT_778442 [Dendrothele bispora CBS 962.96]